MNWITIGAMTVVVLLGASFASLRKQKIVTLEERIYGRKKSNGLKEINTKKTTVIEKLSNELFQSGVNITLPVYLMMSIVSALFIYLFILFLIDTQWLAIASGLLVGVYLPRLVIKIIKDKNMRKFDTAFNKALKRMSASMRTGSTLLQAVQEVVKMESLPQIVRKEMAMILVDYEYGDTLCVAFNHMYERTGLIDVKSVAMSIEIGMKQGTKLYEVFDNYSSAIMERKESEAESQAIVAESVTAANFLVTMPFLFNAAVKYVQPTFFDQVYEYGGGSGKYLFFLIYAVVIFGYIYIRKICEVRI